MFSLCNREMNTHIPPCPHSPSLGPSGMCPEAQDTLRRPERELADTSRRALGQNWVPHAISSCRSDRLGIKILLQHFSKNTSECVH